MGIKVAIMGATGAVGTELLDILAERKFPISELRLLASARSAGKTLQFQDEDIKVKELTHDSFKGIDLVLASAGGKISKEFAPSAVKAGAVVVDNTSAFRMVDGVPLVIPEVNPEDILKHKGIIANPNCSTIIMNVPVWPLHKRYQDQADGGQHLPGRQRRGRHGHGRTGAADARPISRARSSIAP